MGTGGYSVEPSYYAGSGGSGGGIGGNKCTGTGSVGSGGNAGNSCGSNNFSPAKGKVPSEICLQFLRNPPFLLAMEVKPGLRVTIRLAAAPEEC